MNDINPEQWSQHGHIYLEKWHKDKKIHRDDDLPAYIRYYDNGNIEYEKWYTDGTVHRLDGPAIINYYEDGQIESKHWYINNIEITEMDNWLKENNITFPLTSTDEMTIKLVWT